MSHLSISLASVCVFLLTYLLHSTVAVVVVGTIAYRLRRTVNPELRVLMWKMVLLLPVATTLAITVLHTPHFGFQFLIASPSTDVPSAVHETVPAASPVVAPKLQYAPHSVTSELTRGSYDETAVQLNESFSKSIAPSAPSKGATLWMLIVSTWFVGVIVGFTGLIIQLLRLRQLRQRAAVVTSVDIRISLNRLKRQLKVANRVDLLQSADLPGPVTAGLFRPFILIPVDTCELSIAERDALLAHELVHIARSDAWWNLITQVIG